MLIATANRSRNFQRLSAEGRSGHFLEDENQLELLSQAQAGCRFLEDSEISFHHREQRGPSVFYANTSNQPPLTSPQRSAPPPDMPSGGTHYRPDLVDREPGQNRNLVAAHESRLIYLTNSASTTKPGSSRSKNPHSSVIDLSGDWNLRFNGLNQATHMATLHSWSEEGSFKYYSGQVIYEKAIELPANVSTASSLVLDFGEGKPVAN
jgi:hypothetical protein